LIVIKVLYIALGGALGAGLRYLVSLAMFKAMGGEFPWGTLAVNVLGSLVAGFFWGLLGDTTGSQRTQALFFIGLLGAFTTFSAYALDSLQLFQDGRWGVAALNAVGNNAGALLAAVAGYALARSLVRGG
jgi:CrcB protein